MPNRAKSRRSVPPVSPNTYLYQQMTIHRAEGNNSEFAYLKALNDLETERRSRSVLKVLPEGLSEHNRVDWEDFWERLADWLLDHDPDSARLLFSLIKAFRLHETSARRLYKYPEFLATPEQPPFRALWGVFIGQGGCNDIRVLGPKLETLRKKIVEFGHDAVVQTGSVGRVA